MYKIPVYTFAMWDAFKNTNEGTDLTLFFHLFLNTIRTNVLPIAFVISGLIIGTILKK